MRKRIIIIGAAISSNHYYFEINFEVAFLLAPHLLDMDEYYLSTAEFFIRDKYFISLKVKEDWVDIWFAGEFCFFYKPRQDKLYRNADAIIAFGSLQKTNIARYARQMSRKYCPNAKIFFPDKPGVHIWDSLTRVYTDSEYLSMNLYPLRKDFADFFEYLLKSCTDEKLLPIVFNKVKELPKSDEEQLSTLDMVSKVSKEAVYSFVFRAKERLEDFGRKLGNAASNKILKKDLFIDPKLLEIQRAPHLGRYDETTQVNEEIFLQYKRNTKDRESYRKDWSRDLFNINLPYKLLGEI